LNFLSYRISVSYIIGYNNIAHRPHAPHDPTPKSGVATLTSKELTPMEITSRNCETYAASFLEEHRTI